MNVNMVLRKAMTVCVVVAFMSVTTACFGPFNLTRNVYHWNSGIKGSGEVNEKWMKEFVFFGMIIIPVYMFSALLDAFVFNSIQFWRGDNPIKVTRDSDGRIREARIGDTTIVVAWAEDGRSATLTYQQEGRTFKTGKIVEDTQGLRMLSAEGREWYRAEPRADGSVAVIDGDCRLLEHWSPERLRWAGARPDGNNLVANHP